MSKEKRPDNLSYAEKGRNPPNLPAKPKPSPRTKGENKPNAPAKPGEDSKKS